MRQTRPADYPADSRTAPARRGAVLVLVVFFIFLAGALSVVITANSVQLVRTSRNDHESILLRQMADSAHAWLAARPNWREEVPVVLDMTGTLLNGASGQVRIHTDEETPEVVVVNVRLILTDRRLSRTVRFRAPS